MNYILFLSYINRLSYCFLYFVLLRTIGKMFFYSILMDKWCRPLVYSYFCILSASLLFSTFPMIYLFFPYYVVNSIKCIGQVIGTKKKSPCILIYKQYKLIKTIFLKGFSSFLSILLWIKKLHKILLLLMLAT